MQIEVCGREVYVSQQLREYIERRIQFALQRFQRIAKIRVKLRDLNGPRGGVDKSCQLTIGLTAAATLIIEGRSQNAYAAIDSVVDKAFTSIVRRLKRKGRRRRNGSDSPFLNGAPKSLPIARENA